MPLIHPKENYRIGDLVVVARGGATPKPDLQDMYGLDSPSNFVTLELTRVNRVLNGSGEKHVAIGLTSYGRLCFHPLFYSGKAFEVPPPSHMHLCSPTSILGKVSGNVDTKEAYEVRNFLNQIIKKYRESLCAQYGAMQEERAWLERVRRLG